VSKERFLLLGMLTETSSLLRKRIFCCCELVEGFLRVDRGVGTGLRLMLRGDPGVVVVVVVVRRSVSDIFTAEILNVESRSCQTYCTKLVVI
jgi:hypothetical protein